MAKSKETEEVTDNSKEILKAKLTDKVNKKDHFNFEERVIWKISSGSLLLDVAMGGGIGPSLIRMAGHPNSGKTPQAIETLRNLLTAVPNSKGLWVLAEGRLSEENRNRSGLTFVTDPEKWDVGTVFILESNVYELVIEIIKELVLNNDQKIIYGFVIDSIDGMILRGDKDKEISENIKVAGAPLLSKKMLQSLSIGMFKYGHLMVLISQVTSEIKLDPYSKTANRGGNFSGGFGLLHWSDFILEFQPVYPSDIITDIPDGKINDGRSKPIGRNVNVVLQKSTIETSIKKKITYPIRYGKKPSGIWLGREVADLALMFEQATKAGAWINFSDTFVEEAKTTGVEIQKQHQGYANFCNYIESNPEILKYFLEKMKNALL